MLEITINSGHATPDWTAYQPLIVGLGAVILGLIANTLLEWSKRRMDRKGDAKGLRAALLGELQANRQGLDDRIENSNKSEHDSSGTLLIPINNHVHIYNENISKYRRSAPTTDRAATKPRRGTGSESRRPRGGAPRT